MRAVASKKETTLGLPVAEQRAEQEQAAEAAAHEMKEFNKDMTPMEIYELSPSAIIVEVISAESDDTIPPLQAEEMAEQEQALETAASFL